MPHTLQEKPAQIKGNANLITVNDAARLQEQHGGVSVTRQQENKGDNGWIGLNTGPDKEAAWNEDLEDGAKNLAKERPGTSQARSHPTILSMTA